MAKSGKRGLLVGAIMGTLGGLLWIVLLGYVIRSPLFIVLPPLLGAMGVAGMVKLYSLKPERLWGIIGLMFFWLLVLNFVFGNLILDQASKVMPEVTRLGSQFSILHFNVFAGALSVLGFAYLVSDILGKTPRRRQ